MGDAKTSKTKTAPHPPTPYFTSSRASSSVSSLQNITFSTRPLLCLSFIYFNSTKTPIPWLRTVPIWIARISVFPHKLWSTPGRAGMRLSKTSSSSSPYGISPVTPSVQVLSRHGTIVGGPDIIHSRSVASDSSLSCSPESLAWPASPGEHTPRDYPLSARHHRVHAQI